MRRQQAYIPTRVRGFSLLELVVVIVLIGILLVVAIDRLMPYLDEAERVAVLSVESQLKNTLTLEAAKRIVAGRSASIAELEDTNPMDLLLEAPDNYGGETTQAPDQLSERRWYFDPQRRRLFYRTGEPYVGNGRDIPRVNPEFEVRVIYQDRDADGVFNAAKDELFGVRLVRTAGTEWLGTGR